MDNEIGKSKSGNEQESENQAHTNRLTDESLADKASFAGVGEGEQYSEVFWANTVTTTLYQTHPRVPSLTTELKCQYKFENGWIYVRTLRYRMTTRYGNWYRANIDLALNAGAYERKNSPDTMSQDTQWHDYSAHLSVPLGAYGVEVYLQMRIQYDGTNNDVGPSEGWNQKIVPAPPPFITSPKPDQLVSTSFNVQGNGHLPAGTIYLFGLRGPFSVALATAIPTGGGNWIASITLPSDITSFYAVQQIGSERSLGSGVVAIRKLQVEITSPLANTLVNHSQLVFKGTRNREAEISVQDARNNNVTLTVSDDSNTDTWALPLKSGIFVPSGYFLVRAKNQSAGQSDSYSNEVALRMLGFPAIDSEVLQEAAFDLEGDNGLLGAKVEVFEDLSNVLLGASEELTNANWRVKLKGLAPGPLSLVVRQTLQGLSSGALKAHGFRIRPPTLEIPKYEFPFAQTVQFSGAGHYNPKLATRIRFIVKSFPGPTPPNTPPLVDVRNDGSWVVTATGWGLGNYSVEVVQQIADNASGWIDSHACQFDVKHWIPQVSEVTHTPTYRPVFSGKGYPGATVRFIRPDGWEIAPSTVVVNERWSSATLDELGPTKDQTIGIHQSIANVGAPEPLVYSFSIPPQAPGLNDPQENGQSPIFTGTCWPGAEVLLAFNGDGRYVAETDEGQWRYEKPGGFVPGQYTVTVTQIAAEQESVAVRKDFAVSRSVLKPQIDTPLEGAVVAADLIVTGSNGMAGASMQLRDAQYGNALGQPLDLTANGPWSINLTDLSRRWYSIDAQQTLEEQKSEPSDPRAFTVALLAPQITVPEQDGTMPRDGRIEGTGWRGAYVEIWDVDANVQLAADIEVQPDGSWHWELKQLTGHHQLWARQAFAGTRSEESPIRSYRVVPNAPSIETPTADDHVGRRVWVCGFGVPGDKVLATLGDARGEAVVADNRTWSMLLNLSVAGGNHALQVIASSAEFQSEPTLQQLAVGTYLPVIEAPQPGRQVDRNPWFRGHGRPGVGQLVSWFNPEVVWLEHVPVDGGQWQGQSGQSLPAGNTWCWFHQTLTDDQGETVSERVLSSRFEVDAGDAPAKQRR
ncbi:hypothetical protein [Pseudomonas sp. H3_G09]